MGDRILILNERLAGDDTVLAKRQCESLRALIEESAGRISSVGDCISRSDVGLTEEMIEKFRKEEEVKASDK